MKTSLTSLLLCLAGLFACQQQPAVYKSLTTDEFALLLSDPEVQRLDVRTLAEYSEGHIPGSINLNVLDNSFADMADSTLTKEKPVALYCRSGKRSKKAAELLTQRGYEVYELDKGFQSWQSAGLEIEE